MLLLNAEPPSDGADCDDGEASETFSKRKWSALRCHSQRALVTGVASKSDPLGAAIIAASSSFGKFLLVKLTSRFDGVLEPRARLLKIEIPPADVTNLRLGKFDLVNFNRIVETFCEAYVVSEEAHKPNSRLFDMPDVSMRLVLVGRILVACGCPEGMWRQFVEAVDEILFYHGPGPKREGVLNTAFGKFLVDLALLFKAFTSPMAAVDAVLPESISEDAEPLTMLAEYLAQGDEHVRRSATKGSLGTPKKSPLSPPSSPEESPPHKFGAAEETAGNQQRVAKSKVKKGKDASVPKSQPSVDRFTPGALVSFVSVEGSCLMFRHKHYALNPLAAEIKSKNASFPLSNPQLLTYILAPGSHKEKMRWVPANISSELLKTPFQGFDPNKFLVKKTVDIAAAKETPLNFV